MGKKKNPDWHRGGREGVHFLENLLTSEGKQWLEECPGENNAILKKDISVPNNTNAKKA